MKWIRTFLSSIGSLGAFGVIIFLITVIVVAAWLSIDAINQPAIQIRQTLVKLSTLEDKVNYYLLDMDIHADYYIFSGGDESHRHEYEEADAILSQTLVELDQSVGGFSETDLVFYEDLLSALDAHNQAFSALQVVMSQGDAEAARVAQDALETQTELTQEIVTDWIHQVEVDHNQAIKNEDAIVKIAMAVGVLGLNGIPFLAIWAFSKVGDITRPILILSDAVTAMQGGRLRSDDLADVAERRDNLGRLARDIEVMYQQVIARHQSLENELDGLRQQLKDERRRKRS